MRATESSDGAFSRPGVKYSQLHHDHAHEQDCHISSRLQEPHQWGGALSQSHPGLCGTPVSLGPDNKSQHERTTSLESIVFASVVNRIGILSHGNSLEDIDAQLSKVEDDGEEKHRSETSIVKFRRQKKRTESGAVVTSRRLSGIEKRTRSLLSVESKSTVFERRPLQFLARR